MGLSTEGPLLVIIICVSQTSSFGTCKRIQSPVKYLGWSFFGKVAKAFQSLTVFAKCYILDVWWGSEYTHGHTGPSVATKTELP